MHPPHWIVLAAWTLGWVLLWRVPRVPRASAAPTSGPVTVVVPARNEAQRLPGLLDALTPGLAPHVRIVVVDDHSEDDTAEVARRYPGVDVLRAEALPAGWLGKPWACHQGATGAASGELVFLDADVRLTARALTDALAERQRWGGLLSIWPYQRSERPYEHLSALFHVVTFMALGAGSLRPPRRLGGALGPVLLTTTSDYARAGGHAAVRDQIVEDIALGRRYEEAGVGLRLVAGRQDLSCRMYGEGLPGLLRGWSKSLGGGFAAVSPWRVAGIVAWLACALGALTWAGGLPKPASIALGGAYAAQILCMVRQLGQFGVLDALLYPLHVLLVVGVLLLGLLRTHVLRRVAWRGRSYPV